MTCGSHGISKVSFGEGPVVMVCQKLEVLTRSMTHCTKLIEQKTHLGSKCHQDECGGVGEMGKMGEGRGFVV